MYKILVISNSSPSSWEVVGILKRKDFNVIYERSFEEGFQKLLKEKFDLFIAEEIPYDNSFLIFVNRVLNQIKMPWIKGILVCSTTSLIPAGSIKYVLKTPLKPDDLNEAIANALNLRKRSSGRYIVRMHVGIGDEIRLLRTCTTININKGGMLIETNTSLPIGKIYWWTFQGVKELEGVTVKGKVVNEAPVEGFSGNYRYGIQFLEGPLDSLKKIEEFLKESW